MIDKELLNILVCPKCKGNIKLYSNEEYIICGKCNLAYPIDEDIPIMLIDKAIKVEDIDNGN